MVKKSFLFFIISTIPFIKISYFINRIPFVFLIIYRESEVLQFQLRFDIFQIGIYEDI